MTTFLLAVLLTAQDDDAKAQARRILDKCWQGARASLERLGVGDLDKIRESYYKSATDLEKRLAGLPRQHRDPLEKLENPVEGFDGVRSQVDNALKPWPPSIGSYVRFDRKPVPKEEGEKTLAKLVGTWKSEWKAANESRTWTIREGGDVQEECVRRTEVRTEKIKLSFRDQGFIRVLRGTTTQDHTFLFDGDVFYVSGNLLYDAVPVPDRSKFLFRSEWEFVVFDANGCDVIADSGLLTKSEAGFSQKDGREVFTLKFQTPGRKYATTRTYHVIAGHLVHDSLVEAGTFRRQ